MDILTHTATSIALGAFVHNGEFSDFLRAKDMKTVAENMDLALCAQDPNAAMWSLASQLEANLDTIKSKERAADTLSENFFNAATMRNLGYIGHFAIHRENTVVILAICYKYLGEEQHVKRALESFDFKTRDDYSTVDKAVLGAGLVIGVGIGWAFGLSKTLFQAATSTLPEDPKCLVEREAFEKNIRALEPWDGYQKYLEKGTGDGPVAPEPQS